ncbi:hypothetical protein As57867_006170, partial [Aphanomyces stellatus]
MSNSKETEHIILSDPAHPTASDVDVIKRSDGLELVLTIHALYGLNAVYSFALDPIDVQPTDILDAKIRDVQETLDRMLESTKRPSTPAVVAKSSVRCMRFLSVAAAGDQDVVEWTEAPPSTLIHDDFCFLAQNAKNI